MAWMALPDLISETRIFALGALKKLDTEEAVHLLMPKSAAPASRRVAAGQVGVSSTEAVKTSWGKHIAQKWTNGRQMQTLLELADIDIICIGNNCPPTAKTQHLII